VPDTEATKLARSTHQEYIPIKTTDPSKPMRDNFAEKPVSRMDMRLYDTTSCRKDMEGISGVQEALQSNVTTPKTATEAEIEQSGFASRTTADRDGLEDMLSEYAVYTGEQALTALTNDDAARIAGAKAYWPDGMSVDDLLTMVEIEIEAGTTGKPHDATNKEAWGVILPQLTELQMAIHNAQLMGDMPLANAMTEMLKETMQIMGVTADPMRFIPQLPKLPAAGAPLPGAGAGGPPMPGGDMPPGDGGPPIEEGLGTEMMPPEMIGIDPALGAPLEPPPA
jgi:hypothetical protein